MTSSRSAILLSVVAFVALTATSYGALWFHSVSRGSTLRDAFQTLVGSLGILGFLIVAIPYGLTFAILYYHITRFALNRYEKWNLEIEILIAASIGLSGVLTLVFAYPIVCK